MQPHYFVAESFLRAKEQIIEYCEQIPKPFHLSYNDQTNEVEIDRKIKTRKEIEDGPLF